MKCLYLNHKELGKYVEKPFFLPVGTLEAHGGGPIGTDAIIPKYLSKKLAEKTEGIEMPPIYYGITNSLYGYTGTIDIGEIFEEYIYRIGKSLSRYGIKYLFIMNGHGGQIDELNKVGSRLWKEHKIKTAVIHWWMACEKICTETFGGLTGHSGADEFSIVAAILNLDFKKWNEEKSFLAENGIKTYPSPASIIRYSEKSGKMPDIDTAKEFLEKIVKCLETKVNKIITAWKED